MKRKQFLQKSLLASTGLVLLPGITKAIRFSIGNTPVKLKENSHIRHGYYGKEFVSNQIGHNQVINLRIDRFQNMDGDMVLYDFNFNLQNLRMSKSKNELLIHHNNQMLEFDLTKVNGPLLWKSSNQLALVKFDNKNIQWDDYNSALKFSNEKTLGNFFLSIDNINVDQVDDEFYLLIN